MIPCPDDWRQHQSGIRLVLLPPPRLQGVRVFYLERHAPLRSLSSLVEDTLGGDPSFGFGSASSPEQLLTAEGEYAALVEIEGTVGGGRPVLRLIGAVFGEDFSTWLDVVCVRTTLFGEARNLARQLVESDQLALGVRRRRFYFTPPSGWHGIADGLIARFYPPGYPREGAVVTVYPAQPLDAAGMGFHELVVRGGPGVAPPEPGLDLIDGPHRLASAHGLQGLYSRLRVGRQGARRRRTVATFQDRLYGYALTCESPESATAERQHQILLGVANSVQPLPGTQVAGPPARSDQIMKMWGG